MNKTIRTLGAALLAAMAFTATAAAQSEPAEFTYVPNIHGALRARWDLDTRHGDQRFQVRNARVTLDGKIAPSIDYFIQTDLCDAGTMKILDAWGRFRIVKGLTFQAGQFRMPFGVETFRAPQNYIFANRSFMGKQVMNYRAVGAKVVYALPCAPLTLEAGVFNPKAIGNHNPWNRTATYAFKAAWRISHVTLTASYGSIKPYDVRANLIDGALSWDDGKHWLVAAEYMYKHYCHSEAKPVHSWVAFADWHMPVKLGVFNRWSVQLRGDGMTRHMAMDQTKFDAARNRITVGSTLTYSYKILHADVRVNFEKYFYHSDFTPAVGDSDRLVAELVIRF